LYCVKGVEEPIEICEVGEIGIAPLRPPKDTDKAHRNTAGNEQIVLGWRPSVGDAVPETEWVLEAKLGEGAFGEVWLASQRTLKQQRVFKKAFTRSQIKTPPTIIWV